MHATADDQHIITLVLQGRKDAYGILVSRYQNYVFSLVLRYVSVREEAEEVAQDVFIKAYKSLASFRSESKFSTWLFTIVHTTCVSRLRLKKTQLISTDEEMLMHITDQDTSNELLQGLERKSRTIMMEKAINQLNEEDARIVILFYQAEQTLDEIAQILMMPSNTVKVKLHRARQKLRDILVRHFPEEIKDFNFSKSNL